MANFDKVIKLLEQERYRVIGKFCVELASNEIPPTRAVLHKDAEIIKEAIFILMQHNKDYKRPCKDKLKP